MKHQVQCSSEVQGAVNQRELGACPWKTARTKEYGDKASELREPPFFCAPGAGVHQRAALAG